MQNRIKDLLQERGISVKELADKIGMNAPALRYYVRNETQPKADLAIQIARIFDVTPEYVMGLRIENESQFDRDEIPLYGYARGSKRGEAIITDNPIDYVDRPPFVPRGIKAYAVTVTGNSMSPRLQPRDTVYAAPRLPIESGDYVVVQFMQDGERCAIIKQFVSRDDSSITLEQSNPEERFTLPKGDIVAMDRVCGLRM